MATETVVGAKRGIEVILDPSLNKSTAFSEAEKQTLGLVGLVPNVTETEDLQLRRVMMQSVTWPATSAAISSSS